MPAFIVSGSNTGRVRSLPLAVRVMADWLRSGRMSSIVGGKGFPLALSSCVEEGRNCT